MYLDESRTRSAYARCSAACPVKLGSTWSISANRPLASHQSRQYFRSFICRLPVVSRYCLISKFTRRTFSVAGPSVWNSESTSSCRDICRAVFDGEGSEGGAWPPARGSWPPESSAEPLWGVDSNPPKNPRFHFLAKPVYLCTTYIRRLRLYRDRRDLL